MVGRARRTAAPTQSKLVKTPSHAKVYKVGGHGVLSCVSLSSSFPARPSPVAFLVRPPAPTLCSSRSPPPTVAPSLRRSNHHVIQIWQARNSNLAGDDYRSGSPRRMSAVPDSDSASRSDPMREKDIQNDNAVQPPSIDALGGRRARRGGGPHGLAQLAQQGEDSSVQKQRYYSLTLLPPKGCRCTFCEVKTSLKLH